jgi:hypothetical protein
MPTIPSGQQRVGPAALPSIRQNPNLPIEAFGGGRALAPFQAAGAAVEGVTAAISKAYQDEANRTRDIEATEYDTRLINEKAALKNRLQGVKGKPAIQESDLILDEYSKLYKGMQKEIKDPQLNDAVYKRFLQHSSDLNSFATSYSLNEKRVHDIQTLDSHIEAVRSEAVEAATPEAIGSSNAKQVIALSQKALITGKPKEWLDTQIKAAKSATYADTINRLVDTGQDVKALEFFNTFKDGLTQEDFKAVSKVVEASTYEGAAYRFADDLFQNRDLSLKDANAAVRDIADPKLRKLAQDRVDRRWHEIQQERKEAYNGILMQAQTTLEQTGSLKAVPKSLMLSLSDRDIKSLESRAEDLAFGRDPQEDLETYDRLLKMSVDPSMKDEYGDSFMDMNLLRYNSKLSKSHWQEFQKLQAGLKKSESASIAKAERTRTVQKIIAGAVGANKFFGVKEKDKAKVEEFTRYVHDKVSEQAIRNNGKQPTDDDIYKIVDEYMIGNGKSNNWSVLGWIATSVATSPAAAYYNDVVAINSLVRKAKANPDTAVIAQIPQVEHDKIIRALEARRMPTTNENIIKLYAAVNKAGK